MNYLIDGQIVHMRPGVLLFAYAGQAHVLLSETRDFDMWVFLVADVLLPEGSRGASLPPLYVAEADGRLGPRLLSPKAREELAGLADNIATDNDPERQELGIAWWLGRAWHHWLNSGTGASKHVHPALDRAVLAIKEDPTQSLEQVAQLVDISSDRLGDLFRKEMDEGFVAFRNRTRLARLDGAIESDPGINLLGAALDAGFGSYPQFYRVFRELRGVSPYAYYKKGEIETEPANDFGL